MLACVWLRVDRQHALHHLKGKVSVQVNTLSSIDSVLRTGVLVITACATMRHSLASSLLTGLSSYTGSAANPDACISVFCGMASWC